MRRPSLNQRRESAPERSSWISVTRPLLVEQLAAVAMNLQFDRRLLTALLQELGVDDTFHVLVGHPETVPEERYGHAIATALLLRHSWRPDDLEECAQRLGLIASRETSGRPARTRKRVRRHPATG
jgi:hypothetical protein